jgi:hypothetical protein
MKLEARQLAGRSSDPRLQTGTACSIGDATDSDVRSPGLPSGAVRVESIFLDGSSLAGKGSSNKAVASEVAIELVETLLEQAGFFANNLARELPAVIAERERLEKMPAGPEPQRRLAFLRKEQDAALMAPLHLEIYRLELRRHPPFCPYCWMLEGRRMTLKPAFAERETLGCELCGSAY